MNDKFFIDTYVVAYSFNDQQPDKKERSLYLLANALQTGSGIISWQVIQEFLNVAVRKFTVPMQTEDAKVYLQTVLYPLCQVYPDLELYQNALEIHNKIGYSFYDSLIITAAIKGDCSILYTEDLQHGHRIENLRIENPYI